jgi:glycosyltransferase involved in cell wall biosynthesis
MSARTPRRPTYNEVVARSSSLAPRRAALSNGTPRPSDLRVALLSFDFGESCVPFANALSRHAQICLLLPQHERDLYDGPLDESVRFVPFVKPRLRQPFRQLQLMRRLIGEIHRFDPDVVHIQQGHLWLNPSLRFLRRYPLVVTVKDPVAHPGDRGGAKTPQIIMNIAFRAADRLIVHAASLTDELVRVGHVSSDRIHHVPIAFDASVGQVDASLPEEPATLLFFGRIWGYKGLDHLIRAEPLISEMVPRLRIVIAGEGEPFDRYRSLMHNPDRFEVYNTFVDKSLRGRLFSRAAVVVLPYRQASQSGVVPVAYAFAKPVVATTVGGLPEVVDDGVTGLLVPPGDVESLADAIARLLLDEDLRHRLGANGRKKFERTLSVEAAAEKTLDVYRLAAARA